MLKDRINILSMNKDKFSSIFISCPGFRGVTEEGGGGEGD